MPEPLPLPKRVLRRILHEALHRFVLNPSKEKTRRSRAAGFDLVVPPTVFHPRFFLSSEIFASFVRGLDLKGRRVADIGTGSGILALAAARAGAERVLAVDVNPAAARAARANARANGLGDRVDVLCADLLGAVAPGARFDVLLSNPPFFEGEPRDVADRAWHAGPGYRDVAPLFAQARERLAPGGAFYVVLSSDADLDTLKRLFAEAGFRDRVAHRRDLLFESMLVFELRA